MLALTGTPLLLLSLVLAVLCLAGAVAIALRRSEQSWGRRLLGRALPVGVVVVLAQVFAMAALALQVNDQYAFYTSWADLTGGVAQRTAISTTGLLASGQGNVHVATLHAPRTGPADQVLVWTPPQYDQPAYRHHRFPVVVFLPGQPSSPQVVFHQFQFGQQAVKAIDGHQTPPFVAVFPTLMVHPPRDTECTNVAGGPQAETWLTKDVPAYVSAHYRVAAPGRSWTAMGWSTGGFCAAKLVTTEPHTFGSGVSFGGYYQPLQDNTTGSLFAGRRALKDQNSPQWLYTHHGGLRGARLLLVAGQQDHETWRSTRRMLNTTAGDPSVAHISFPQGGHNYHNYRAYLPAALHWGAGTWSTSAPTGG